MIYNDLTVFFVVYILSQNTPNDPVVCYPISFYGPITEENSERIHTAAFAEADNTIQPSGVYSVLWKHIPVSHRITEVWTKLHKC